MAPAGPGQAPQDVAHVIVSAGWAKVRDGVGEGDEAVRCVSQSSVCRADEKTSWCGRGQTSRGTASCRATGPSRAQGYLGGGAGEREYRVAPGQQLTVATHRFFPDARRPTRFHQRAQGEGHRWYAYTCEAPADLSDCRAGPGRYSGPRPIAAGRPHASIHQPCTRPDQRRVTAYDRCWPVPSLRGRRPAERITTRRSRSARR